MTDRLLQDLVIAMLATYQFPLERAWALREPLAAAGLMTPEVVLALDTGELGNALKEVGYDRGGVTYIIAPRLRSLLAAARGGLVDELAQRVAARDEAGFRRRLEAVDGFGPKGSGIAWDLATA
jgi:hypothetical protein